MSGTAQTIATLNTEYADNTTGAITAQFGRNTIATLGARTGNGSVVRVTDPEYGADPTGVSDSTAAFQNALAAGTALVPSLTAAGAQAKYLVNSVTVPSGAQLIGYCPMNYNVSAHRKPVLHALNGGTLRMLEVDGSTTILIQGITFDGYDGAATNSTDGISAGGVNITVRDCSFTGLRYGIGGAVAGSTATFPTGTWIVEIENCAFLGCVAGITNFIDGQVIGGKFANCGNGVLADSAAGADSFIGVRFEECGDGSVFNGPVSGYGVNLTSCSDQNFTGCTFDQNGNAAMLLNGARRVAISGCWFRRNGCNVASGTTLIANSCHMELQGVSHVVVTGCMTDGSTQTDSGHHSVFCPAAVIHYTAPASVGVILSGNDFTGYQGSTTGASNAAPHNSATGNPGWFTGTAPISTTGQGINAYIVSKNLGTGASANDIDSR